LIADPAPACREPTPCNPPARISLATVHRAASPPQLLPDLAHAHRPGSCRRRPVGPKPCHAALACTVLPLQPLNPFPLHPSSDPREVPDLSQPGRAASPPCSRSSPLSSQSRRIPRRTSPPMLLPPHGSRRLLCHRSILSKVGASGNPGTVHPGLVRAGLTTPAKAVIATRDQPREA
jgi:hypothetical protein